MWRCEVVCVCVCVCVYINMSQEKILCSQKTIPWNLFHQIFHSADMVPKSTVNTFDGTIGGIVFFLSVIVWVVRCVCVCVCVCV